MSRAVVARDRASPDRGRLWTEGPIGTNPELGVRQEAEPIFAYSGRAESLQWTGRKPTVDEPKAYREPREIGG